MNFLIHTRRGTISRQTTSPVEPPEDSLLLGVGSESTSLTLYPRIQNTTIGNWYVDASRPISGDGTTLATAFKTLQEGLNALQSGQTLLVKGGTYTPGRMLRNTAWGSTTRIMGYGNDRPILDFDGVDMTWPNRHCLVIESGSRNELWHRFYFINSRNNTNTGGVVSINAPTTTISDIWASHMDYRTVEISGVTNGWVTVQDCVGWRMGDGSSANTSTGEHFLVVGSGRDSTPEEIRFVRCVSINGGDDGFDLWSARSALILDSVSIGAGFYWNGNVAGDGNGYKMGGDSGNGRNNRLRGSVAVYSSRYGIDANISASSQYGQFHYVNNTTVYNDSQGFFLGNHVHVENNIDYGNGASYRSPGGSTTYSNNQWNLSISNPQLANPSEHDFSLAEGSPARGVGTGGANLGASTVALELTKLWASRDTTGYALPEWSDDVIIPPVEPPEEPGETQTVYFTEDTTTDFNNPERGWYVEDGAGLGVTKQNPVPIRGHIQYTTLQMYFVRLDDYVNTDVLPTNFINNLANTMASWRTTGKKAILRFGYSRTADAPVTDTAWSRMSGHIDQIAPLLHEYKDVIGVFQAGFVGRWGEMHDSTSGIAQNNANGRAFVNKIMEVTPSDMIVEFRTPYWMTNTLPNTDHLAYEDRFTETKHARIGHFNDCIAAGEQWVTWWGDTPGLTWQQERDYAFNQGRLTSAGGETCSARGLGPSNDGALVISQFEQGGWDYLNSEYWTDMYSKWENSGHLAEISRRLGYRLALTEAVLPTELAPGQSFTVSFTLHNQGFGKVFKPRPIDLVFVQGETSRRVRLTPDARRDLPLGGETKTLTYTAVAPANLSDGSHSLHLALPDPSVHLENDPRYSIRLANPGTWNGSTGNNSLNANVLVGGEHPEETILLGVGSTSTSLNLYPKIQNTTEGDWYVDGSRSTSGNGQSLATAFRTIQEGLSALQSGQTLLVKGGTYNLTSRLNRTTNWSTRTRIMAYGNDRPVITAVGFTTANDAPLRFQSQSRNELWHRFYIRDVMSGSGQSGIMSAGQNTLLSDMWVSHVSTNGIYTTQGNSNNIVQDCAVWHLGDGSSVHTNTGDCFVATAWDANEFADTKFVRCFGANGPDDVYDLWGGVDNEIIDSVAYGGGYYWNGNPGSSSGGDGGGYKLGGGGNGMGKRNTIIGSLALGNRTQGYQFNHSASPAEHTIINNTAYNNGGTGVSYGTASTTRNNISYQNGSSHGGSGGTVTNNSWQVGVSNPQFADIGNHDYSLASNSGGIGTGYGGENLGASEEALRIAKIWLNRDLTGYAQPEWDYDSPPTQTQSYTIDTTTNFLNPERGWHSDRASTSDFSGLRSGQWQNTPQTLNRWIGRLDQFRDSAITQSWLDSHANVFQAARNAGIKLELRYAYSYNPPTSPPDAEPSRIIQHINQLGPIWQANADVINTIQAGFVGRWGEWNASGFGITSGADPTVRNSIIQALVDNVPENRMITLRYPEMTAEYFGHHINQYPSYPAPVSHSERFTGTPKARLGLLDDSFLANHTDGGTFVVNRYTANYSTNTHSMAYWVSTSRYTANSGETVDLDWRDGNREAGAASIARMEELNWDILNRAYSTRVINGWISSGHYEEISRRLGYRLGLTSVTLPQYIRQGAYFTVEFTLQNDGFGKVFNPRPIDLVLTPSTGSPVRVRLTSDARRDLPLGGETSTLTYVATLPGNAPTGSYTAGISLPDPYPSLENDARYSIRLANTGGIWNGSTGVNNLGLSVSIV